MTRPHLVLALGLLAAGAIAPAQVAPNAVVTFEPIVVTAQYRRQAVTEVPISVSAYRGTFLEDEGVTSYDELAPLVPGFFASIQSANNPSLNLRGITLDSTDPRAEARVSVFQDGVSTSRSVASVAALFDVERVEVLKGPQSTLFGRSAEAGAISIVSRRPEAGTNGRLTVGAGNFGRRAASGYLNLPLNGERLLGRVAFTAERHDGVVPNLADGSTLSGRETIAARPSLRWIADDGRTTLDLIVNWQRDTPPGTAFKSGVVPTSRGDLNPFTPAELNRGAQLGLDRTVWGATALLAHPLSPAWTMHAVSGWRDYDAHEEFDGDGSRLYLLETAIDNRGRQYSQELRFDYDADRRLAGSIGASWFHERGRQQAIIGIDERVMWPFVASEFRDSLLAAGVPPALITVAVPPMNPLVAQAALPAGFAAFANVPTLASLAPLAGAPLQPRHADTYFNTATLESTDLFADGTWSMAERLELTAGVRIAFERQRAGYLSPVFDTPSRLGFVFDAAPNFTAKPTAGELVDYDNDTAWTGRLAARWILNASTSAYASLSRGRRPATFVITSTDRFRASEESMLNGEVGLKGRLADGRLLWSAAAFRYHYSHFQTLVRDPANLSRFISVDAGRATGRGGEFSLQGVLTRWANVLAAYGYTDATFDETDGHGAAQRFAGSTPRLTARHTAAFGLELSHPTARGGRISFSPMLHYRSAHYFDDDNTANGGTLRQPGFAVVNARLTWAAPRRQWEVTVFATNLFDRDYLIDGGNIGASLGLPTFVRGEPRLWGIDLTRRF